jgi:pimeloyl-ACP methyl ester carboxylesterase
LNTQYDPVGPNAGPSERVQDFAEGSGLLKKGYTFVMVDLRGFGGSNGCLDWAGAGEQYALETTPVGCVNTIGLCRAHVGVAPRL